MEETKINYKRSFMIAFLISIFLTIVCFVIYIQIPYQHIELIPKEVQANNIQFEAYFGDYRSAAETKQLCSLVRSHNLACDKDSNSSKDCYSPRKMALLYKDSSGISQKEPSEISTLVSNNYRYIIHLKNDRASNELPDNISDNDASYYDNGLIRIISIEENNEKNNSVNNQIKIRKQNIVVNNQYVNVFE